jgi:hypothetical protein
VSCAERSLEAGEQLAATATTGGRWLLVEVRGAWGRDAVADTGLPDRVREMLDRFEGRVLLIRRPGRRRGVTVVHAEASEGGGGATSLELDALEELPDTDVTSGLALAGELVLVCAHGRRDACCARLGVPLYDAIAPHLPAGSVWQSSHLGGHRFAPNVLVLPHGTQFGRVPVGEAPALAAMLGSGRILLDHYRGRTLYAPPVQAAEIVVRRSLGLDRIGDLRLLAADAGLVRFAAGSDEVTVRVEEAPGPIVPVSCGADPEATAGWSARIQSVA